MKYKVMYVKVPSIHVHTCKLSLLSSLNITPDLIPDRPDAVVMSHSKPDDDAKDSRSTLAITLQAMDTALSIALPLLEYKRGPGDILLNPAQINLARHCFLGPLIIYHNVTVESRAKARKHELVYESKYTESFSRSTNDCLQSIASPPCFNM